MATPRFAGSVEQQRVWRLVESFAQAQGLEFEPGRRDDEMVVVLPGEQKLRTVCSVTVGTADLSAVAFVIRHPDENHTEFFRALLRRNLRRRPVGYALDALDDVYVVGRLPLAGVDEDVLDRFFGAVLEAADGAFNDLLLLGFRTSMQREWAWRIARGESLHNLEAFRDDLAGSEHDPRFAITTTPGLDLHQAGRPSPEGSAGPN
ncbi:hypothetical protein KEM60_00028 [Austwickia sp. TVS 96-490-7B]|uniref:YbjN domain-containing protein n=1 Tax=Austwickia sp. TVS 96-490-7B TaxID=2830843 RepID=UPI001C569998|nr:YbjN domain-containing protein [Austwickia sp. TVS 96-490-7B]MBW3083850.1 hypothetical protein [Austwickia sp. TVS 96-490-7B]